MQMKSSISLVYHSLTVYFFVWNTVTCSHKSEIKTESSAHGIHHSKQSDSSSPAVDNYRNYFESIMMMRMASEKETGHGKSSLGLPSGSSAFLNYGRKSAPAKQRHKKTTRDKTITYSALAKETKKALVLLKSLHYLMSSEKDRKIKPNMQEIEMLHNILSKPPSNKIRDKKNRYSKPVSERKETLKNHTIKSSSGNKSLFSSTDLARIFQTLNNRHNEMDIHSRQKEKEFPLSNSAQQFSPVDLEFMKSFISFVNQMKSKSKNMKTDVRSDIERKKLDPARVTLQVDPGLHLFIQNGNDMGTETSFGTGKSIKPKYILKTTSAGTEDRAALFMSNSDSKIKPETFVLSSRENKKVFEVLAPSKFESPEYFTHLQRTNRNDEARRYRQRPPMFNSLRKNVTDDRSSNFISKSNLENKRQITTLSKYLGHSERLVQRPSVSDLIKSKPLGEVNREMKPALGRFSIISIKPTSNSDQRRPSLVPFDIHNNQESHVLHVTHKQPHLVDSNPLNINIEERVSHKTRHLGLQGHLSSNTLEALKRLHKVDSLVSNQPVSHSQILIGQKPELNDRRTHAINNDMPFRVLEQQSRNKIIYQDRLFHDVNAGRTNVYDESRSRFARNKFPVMQQYHTKYIDVSNNVPAENRDLVTRVRHGTGSQQYRFNKDPVNGIYSQRKRLGPSQYYNSVQNNKHRLHIQETSPSSLLIRHSQHQTPGSRNSNDAIPHYTSEANKQIIHVIHHTENMPSNSKFHHPKKVESYRADHTVPSHYLSGSNSKRSEHFSRPQKSPQNSNVPMAHSSQFRQRNEHSVSVNTEKQTLHRGRSGLNYVAENQRVSKSFPPRAIHHIYNQNTATGLVKSNSHPYDSIKINDNRYNALRVEKRIQQASSESMLDKHIRPESSRFTQQFRSFSNGKPLTGNRHTSQMTPDANIVNAGVMTNADHRAATHSVHMHQSFNDVPKNQGGTIHTQAGFDFAHNTKIPTRKSDRHKIETYSYDPRALPSSGRYYEGTNRRSKRFPAIPQPTVKYVQTKIIPQEAGNQNKKVHGTNLSTTRSTEKVPSSEYSMNSNAWHQNANRQQHLGNSRSVNALRTAQHQQHHHKMSKKVTEPTKFMPSNHVSNFERKAIQKINEYHKPTELRQQQVIELTNKLAARNPVNHGGIHSSLHRQEPNKLTGYGIPEPRSNYDPSVAKNQPVSPGKVILNERYPQAQVETPANTTDNLTALRTELNSLISRFNYLQMHGSRQNVKRGKQAAYPTQADVFQSPYRSRVFPSKEIQIKKEPYHKIRNTAFDKFQNTINVNAETTNMHHGTNEQRHYTRQSKHLPNFVDGGLTRNGQNGVPVKFQNQEKSGVSLLPQSSQGGNLKNANQNVNTSKVALNLHREKFSHPSARIPVTVRTNSSIPNHSANVSQQLMAANSTASKSNIPLTKNTMLINRQQKVNSSKHQTLLQTKSKISSNVIEKPKYKRQKAPSLPSLGSKGVKPNTYQQRHSAPMQNNFYNKLGSQNPATEIKLQIQPSSHDVRFEVSVQARKQISKPNVQTVKDFQNVVNASKSSNIQPF